MVGRTKNLKLMLGLSAVTVVVAAAPAAAADPPVCNEASKGQRGDYIATGDIIDPLPPARYKTELAPLPGKGGGLHRAATKSPALTLCGPGEPPVDPGDGGTDGGDGGTDGGDGGTDGGDGGTDDGGEIIGGGGPVIT